MEIYKSSLKYHFLKLVLGTALIIFGAVALYVCLTTEFGNPLVHLILFWFGVLPIGFGFLLGFYVERYYLNRHKRELTISKGFIFKFLKESHAFSDIKLIKGRKHILSRGYDLYGHPVGSLGFYQGYLVLADETIEFGENKNKQKFLDEIQRVKDILNIPLNLSIERISEPVLKDPPSSMVRIVLLLSFVTVISWALLKYQWPLIL